MGFSRPKSIKPDGETRCGGGGGPAPGGSDPWQDWITLPNDPTDGWTKIEGSGGAGCTATLVGDQMHVYQPAGLLRMWRGPITKGFCVVRSLHLMPWAEAGLQVPPGEVAHGLQPESVMLKIEVQLDDTSPISGSPSNGSRIQCGVGLFHYPSDRGGTPTFPVANEYCGTIMYKHGAALASAETSFSSFRMGRMTSNGFGYANGDKWRCQPGMASTGHDSIVFQAGIPIGSGQYTNENSVTGGSYATQVPYQKLKTAGFTFTDNATRFAGDRYCHIALFFGTTQDQTGLSGTVKIKSIRYTMQPLVNRAELVGA